MLSVLSNKCSLKWNWQSKVALILDVSRSKCRCQMCWQESGTKPHIYWHTALAHLVTWVTISGNFLSVLCWPLLFLYVSTTASILKGITLNPIHNNTSSSHRQPGGGLVMERKFVLFNDASRAHWFSYHWLLDVRHMVIVTYFFLEETRCPHIGYSFQ